MIEFRVSHRDSVFICQKFTIVMQNVQILLIF